MRSHDEVQALWPRAETYTILGRVAVDGATTRQQAAARLQLLYDDHEQTVAGGFQVVAALRAAHRGDPVFLVRFCRDVGDDAAVLQTRLTAGDDFFYAVVDQLREELENADGCVDMPLTVTPLWFQVELPDPPVEEPRLAGRSAKRRSS